MRGPISLKADRKGVDSPILVSATVLITCLLIVAGISLADALSGGEEAGIRTASHGDTVRVDYIGTFDNGWVFDTSLWTVANDSDVPKSFSFTKRSQSQYQPLEYTIGEGRYLAKFESAVKGLAVGETITVTLTAEEGYGPVPASNLVSRDIVQQIPARETMSLDGFESFFGEPATNGLTVIHPVYGWEVVVQSISIGLEEVIIKNMPSQGERYWTHGDRDAGQGFEVRVDSVSNDSITITNLVDASMANSVKGVDGDGRAFFLHAVAAGNMYLKYDQERVGQNLTFTITLRSIL